MTRVLKRLSVRTVATLKKPGRHADGSCLYLKISKTRAGLSKRWTFMYTIAGRQREMGLGAIASVTLTEARERASEARSLLRKGIEPPGPQEGCPRGR
jgi:Arm DNA-binding domain